MGRPIKKKFFGDLNPAGVGGEGIASINWSYLGLFRGDDAINEPLVGLDLPAPSLPGGVQATWTVTFEVASVSTGAGKAGLVVGDTYTYAAGGSPTITVASVSGSNATFTTTGGSGVTYGSLPKDTTGVNITKVTGSGVAIFLTDINFKVKSATIDEKGSGYTGAETFTVTTYSATTGAAPAGTIVLTSTQQNALSGVAYLLAKDGGASAKVYDIIKQEASHRYLVKTADGIGQCKLVASNTPTAGQMNLIATDANGSTYWVTKLTARRAILTRRTMSGSYAFATNSAAGWTIGAASTGVVSIANI